MIIANHTCTCGRCKIESNQKELVAVGKKTRYVLKNPAMKVVSMYVVDDCLLKVKSEEEKCDYLFDVGGAKLMLLIECKGSDVLKAVHQLQSTLTILQNELKEHTCKARIISTRVYSPDVRDKEYRKLRERLLGQLDTKNKVYIETI